MVIWIRADGNEEIASGHLRRTLTIAEALQRHGAETLFLLSGEDSRNMFLQLTGGNRSGWRYLLLGCPYGDIEKDLCRMRELFSVGVPDWLLVDSYAASSEYYVRLKEMAAETQAVSSSVENLQRPGGKTVSFPVGNSQWSGENEMYFSVRNSQGSGEKAVYSTVRNSQGSGGKAFSSAATGDLSGREEGASRAASNLPGNGCCIACLDDLMAFDPPVDLVINYAPDVTAAQMFYHRASVRLLGPAYVPLRPQFLGMEPDVREQVSRILISTGGADPFGMADAAAWAVRSAMDPGQTTWNFTSDDFATADDPRKESEAADSPMRLRKGSNVSGSDVRICHPEESAPVGRNPVSRKGAAARLCPAELVYAAPGHPYISNMAAILKRCDLAVSAGGTTLYELCAAGVPTIAFSMAENQQIFAKKMAEAGACTYAGDVRDPKERAMVLQRISGWIRERCGNEETGAAAGLALRQQESARMRSLTDGCGADRIAKVLLEGGQEPADT